MQCGLNDYAPEGKPVHEIIEELASDNEHFAKVFLGEFHSTLPYDNFILKIKNTFPIFGFPIFGYMMHFW